MRLTTDVAGVRFTLDTAAVSAIRYRAEYGESAAETGFDGKKLLRLFHIMIVPEERRPLEELARLARKDKGFLPKALEARDALMADDPLRPTGEEVAREPFDEYQVLALMAAAGVEAFSLPRYVPGGLLATGVHKPKSVLTARMVPGRSA